jgi:hypothetical protein
MTDLHAPDTFARRRVRSLPVLAFLPFAALQLGADDTGCRSESSADVAQERIWSGFWTFYDAQGDTTDLRAAFRFGSAVGTPLRLEAPARVSYAGQDLGFDEVWDWHATRRAGRVETGAFEYYDVDGGRFAAPLRAFRRAEVPSGFPAALDADRSHTLTWDGPPLGPGEVVEVNVANADNRADFVALFQRSEDATSIVLDAERLGRVGPGAAVLVLRRTAAEELPGAPGAGGRFTTTYQSREHALELR